MRKPGHPAAGQFPVAGKEHQIGAHGAQRLLQLEQPLPLAVVHPAVADAELRHQHHIDDRRRGEREQPEHGRADDVVDVHLQGQAQRAEAGQRQRHRLQGARPGQLGPDDRQHRKAVERQNGGGIGVERQRIAGLDKAAEADRQRPQRDRGHLLQVGVVRGQQAGVEVPHRDHDDERQDQPKQAAGACLSDGIPLGRGATERAESDQHGSRVINVACFQAPHVRFAGLRLCDVHHANPVAPRNMLPVACAFQACDRSRKSSPRIRELACLAYLPLSFSSTSLVANPSAATPIDTW